MNRRLWGLLIIYLNHLFIIIFRNVYLIFELFNISLQICATVYICVLLLYRIAICCFTFILLQNLYCIGIWPTWTTRYSFLLLGLCLCESFLSKSCNIFLTPTLRTWRFAYNRYVPAYHWSCNYLICYEIITQKSGKKIIHWFERNFVMSSNLRNIWIRGI